MNPSWHIAHGMSRCVTYAVVMLLDRERPPSVRPFFVIHDVRRASMRLDMFVSGRGLPECRAQEY